jgi:ABC-type multidrug transport system ATPase subunit
MNPKETQEITELIELLRTDGGYTILVIEHDMHVVEGISDRVVALDHGLKIAEGTFEGGHLPQVVEAYPDRWDGEEMTEAPRLLLPRGPTPTTARSTSCRTRTWSSGQASSSACLAERSGVDDAEDDPRPRPPLAPRRPGSTGGRTRRLRIAFARFAIVPENRRLSAP